MFDNDHVAFDNETTYPNSSFSGAKVFAFATSDTATTDTVLGIKVKYNTVNNVGDIVFDSDHTSGTFTYKSDTQTLTKQLSEGHLHYTTGRSTHNSRSAWIKRTNESKQRVIRTFLADDTEKQLFQIDFYKNSASLTDLEVSVSVNGTRKTLTTDYTLVNGTTNTYVKFVKALTVDDQVRIAGHSSADKLADKGIYEIPENLATNSLNQQLATLTFGQILGHVRDIFDKNQDVTGAIPGTSNLRDKPDARLKGGSIHQHEAPLLPAVFGLIDQDVQPTGHQPALLECLGLRLQRRAKQLRAAGAEDLVRIGSVELGLLLLGGLLEELEQDGGNVLGKDLRSYKRQFLPSLVSSCFLGHARDQLNQLVDAIMVKAIAKYCSEGGRMGLLTI
jgi:hypothetical protein